MDGWVLEHERVVRLGFFAAMLPLMAAWEEAAPRRKLLASKPQRRAANLGVVAVVLFEVLLNASCLCNHGNVRLPSALDRLLRALVVTPDMHRVHHSIDEHETNSNFGFTLSLWDRVFGTYRDQPAAGHAAMIIGLRGFRDPAQCVRLSGMLRIPFIGGVADYAINRRSYGDGRPPDGQ